jgi:transposase InsO family protein
VKVVAETLGVSRSNLVERLAGSAKPRRRYQKAQDAAVLPLLRRLVDARPTYGYRRITALLNRDLAADGRAPANHKRVYRLMKVLGLLLEKHSGQRPGRSHDGKVVMMRSDLRWCSDGFEFTCWNGEIVRGAFVLDAHDREVIAWRATTGAGISGSDIRDMMLEAVEARFGDIRAAHPVEWLSDNGSIYTAREDPRVRHPAQPRPLLHAGGELREQRHERGLREDPEARLPAREPRAGRQDRA